MQDIKDVYISPLPDSPYVKPFRLNYTQNGKQKNWDLLEVHDSVAIIVFNVTRKVMVMVKQFRPAIYYNSVSKEDRAKSTINTDKYPGSLGVALEMCAGIVDKNKSLDEIAREEVLEECGYNVEASDLSKVMSYRSGVGVQGSLQTLYYCEVTDDMKTNQGGGVDDEIIDVVEKTIPELEEIVSSPGPVASPPSCLFDLKSFIPKSQKSSLIQSGSGLADGHCHHHEEICNRRLDVRGARSERLNLNQVKSSSFRIEPGTFWFRSDALNHRSGSGPSEGRSWNLSRANQKIIFLSYLALLAPPEVYALCLGTGGTALFMALTLYIITNFPFATSPLWT
ncbi:Uridine diphosphate glucose pyrophosphatase [Eumeta japonica]|uniref:Uridine diphosphate glucose pyrophosphatase NUDT14 n=1 Tax=Eumeta variegata TaxID=151549 RepID=A0A4C1U961_EUMVA|nr:Uridine diphosphate glucose pyrophosphatase [Eumeta japonica]